MSVIRFNI